MSSAASASELQDIVEQARKKLPADAKRALDAAAEIARRVNLTEPVQRLIASRAALDSDTFNLIIAGRFKNGKSTLMNALLEQRTHATPEFGADDPMAVDALPCTAVLTTIVYADKPFLQAIRMDGKVDPSWTLHRYLREARVKENQEENERLFRDIREFTLGFPAALCQAGVRLLDSPGTDDTPQRTQRTMQAIEKSDAAMIVFRSDAFAGMSDRDLYSEIDASGTRPFVIVNMMYDQPIDERFRSFVWNRLVTDSGGPHYSGQDFATKDIYFINALQARQAKRANDASLLAASGMSLLEQRIGNFLVYERLGAHLTKYVTEGITTINVVKQHLSQQLAGLQRDQEQLESAYQAIQPKLEEVRKRREWFPALFERYRLFCARDLEASFNTMFATLRRDLPGEIQRRLHPYMPTGLAKLIAPFKQKKMLEKAYELAGEIIRERLEQWKRKEIPAVLGPHLDNMFDELNNEVEAIGRTYDEVQYTLTGWTATGGAPTSLISVQERVLSAVAGIFVGDFTALLGPLGGGYRTVAGALAGQVGAILIFSLLGITGSFVLPVALIAGMITAIVWGGVGLEERITKVVMKKVDENLGNLSSSIRAEISHATSEQFGAIEQKVTGSIQEIIAEEELNIQTIMEDNRKNYEQKRQIVEALNQALTDIGAQEQALRNVLAYLTQSQQMAPAAARQTTTN